MISDDRVTRFHEGQVWENSAGYYVRVMQIENGQAVLRKGADGSGRITRRPWDGISLRWGLVGDPTAPEEYPVGQDSEGKGG
ncbi:hypothetical protein [Thioalkalivibrio sp. ALE19]|uniref:hypothetical protein n=1 Tax=Thioalkalivibrio sp. ALE19 TaxID=1266909 RepID=UPI0003697715|nr:hypothetical protein [Thioalkalivibrio sp. ALE19]